jgi:hypothetical protein
MPPARPLFLSLMLLAGCADAPSLDGRISAAAAAAPYPQLQPLAPLLAQAALPGRITPASTVQMDGNTAGLRARAAALRGPVVDAATRARMQRAIARAALR